MVRLNLSLDDVGNCEETAAFVKKGILSLAYIQSFHLKSKELGKFRASKTHKSAKFEVAINFK